jgi:hypothetical protein
MLIESSKLPFSKEVQPSAFTCFATELNLQSAIILRSNPVLKLFSLAQVDNLTGIGEEAVQNLYALEMSMLSKLQETSLLGAGNGGENGNDAVVQVSVIRGLLWRVRARIVSTLLRRRHYRAVLREV